MNNYQRISFFFVFILLLLSSSAEILAESALLTQQMVDRMGRRVVVDRDYTLGGRQLTLPRNSQLVYAGGRLSNGTLEGNGSSVKATSKKAFLATDLRITGIWRQTDVYDTWFEHDNDSLTDSYGVISSLLAFTSDEMFNHLHFSRGREYFFRLPYNGRADFGSMISVFKENDKVRRRYGDLCEEEYSYLRMFSIPSNTKVTIDAKLKLMPTKYGAYFIFFEKDKHDIIIDGIGSVYGDNPNHLMTGPMFKKSTYYGEQGFVFFFSRCHNVEISNITVADAFGDCIYYSGSYDKNDSGERWASGLTLDGVTVSGARRNGVTCAARDCVIRHCIFERNGVINGTYPKSGIDFEADYLQFYDDLGNERVRMTECEFRGNERDVAAFNVNVRGYLKTAVTIADCNFTAPLSLAGSRWLHFDRCIIPGIVTPHGQETWDNLGMVFNEFVDCEIGGELPEKMFVETAHNKFIRCQFVR